MTTSTSTPAATPITVTARTGAVFELRPYDGRCLVDARSAVLAKAADHRRRESFVRVQSALCAGRRPEPTYTVALVSGEISAACDLAIALFALGRLEVGAAAYAELALDGRLREVPGSFLAGRASDSASAPLLADGPAARWRAALGLPVLVASTLEAVLAGEAAAPVEALVAYDSAATPLAPKRVCLVGAHGSGMTLAAASLARQPITPAEHREVLAVQSQVGMLRDPPALARPFRAPHHTVSSAGLVGDRTRPGEVHLARHGVLLLDDLVEFRQSVIEALAHAAREVPVTIVATHYHVAAETPERRARLARYCGLLELDAEEFVPPEPTAVEALLFGL